MRFWVVFAVILGVACEKTEPTDLVIEDGAEFFDPGALEGAASLSGWTDVPCPGSSKEERSAEKPWGILRGEVAATLGYGADVRVQLVTVGKTFEVSKVLHETHTDELNRFCFKLPKAVEAGPHLMIHVGSEGQEIVRRMVLDLQDVNVGPVHEALLQLIQERKTPLEVPNLINLHTVAYSAVDLLNETQRTSQVTESEVEYLKSVLVSDDRTQKLLGSN